MLSQIFCAVTIFHQFQLYFLPFSPYSFSNPFQSFFSVRKKRGTDRRRCVDASKFFVLVPFRVYGYVSTSLLITLTISWIWLKLHLFVTKVLYMAFPLLMGLKSGWLVNLYFPFCSLLNFALVITEFKNWTCKIICTINNLGNT